MRDSRSIRARGNDTEATAVSASMCTHVARLLTLILILAVPSSAHAGGDVTHVVIFPLEGKLSRAQARTLARALEKATKASGKKVTMAESSVDDMAMISGCESPDDIECQGTLLEQLSAHAGVTGSVKMIDGDQRMTLKLKYFDGRNKPRNQRITVDARKPRKQLEDELPVLFGEPVVEIEPSGTGASRSGESTGETGLPGELRDNGGSTGRIKKYSWAMIGGGGGLMATGMVFWLLASNKQGAITNARTDTLADLNELADIESSAKARATTGNVLFFSGVIVAAVGAAMAVRQTQAASRTPGRATPKSSTTSILAPTLMPGGMGIAFSTEWH